MRGALIGTAVIAAAILVPLFLIHGKPPTAAADDPSCGTACAASSTAVAVWRVWNEVDCDDADWTFDNGTCQDESQNINHAATIGPLIPSGSHACPRCVIVPVTIVNGNAPVTYCVRVDAGTGQALTNPLCPTGKP